MEDNSKYIGKLSNGTEVYDRDNSHWQTAHKEISKELLVEALSKLNISADEEMPDMIIQEVDMGRIIGKNNCIPINSFDQTFMARRFGRECLTNIVINKVPINWNKIVVILNKQDDHYVLLTTYIGDIAPMEPGDPALLKTNDQEKIEEAKKYWSSHALVYKRDTIEYVISPDGQELDVDTFEKEYIGHSQELIKEKTDENVK